MDSFFFRVSTVEMLVVQAPVTEPVTEYASAKATDSESLSRDMVPEFTVTTKVAPLATCGAQVNDFTTPVVPETVALAVAPQAAVHVRDERLSTMVIETGPVFAMVEPSEQLPASLPVPSQVPAHWGPHAVTSIDITSNPAPVFELMSRRVEVRPVEVNARFLKGVKH